MQAGGRLPRRGGVSTLPAMKLLVRHAGGELTVGSQKELLLLWQRGVIAADDIVRREGQERWTGQASCPGSAACGWTRGRTRDACSG